MRIITKICIIICFLAAFAVDAQELTEKRLENPEWLKVISLNMYPGTYDKAMDLMKTYFLEADKQAGLPAAELTMEMVTGEYDLVIVWKYENGIESLNWELSPETIKWYNALVGIAGSKEEADAILEEYWSYVKDSKVEISRKLN
ncbi:hypothetical protein [Robertkochia solimangrovi]|uniref:hypothetical protein n=1 Tax=Robertkochia solimangrovi TaxID=2213046 RepID=UPI00117C945D|nr:hypothetical protein [Robertkochia solimangrovi]TRZ41847.1 hypothetical protein DMZ48_16005 [Robertkochia solimangrovi]